jgi:pimeloyl-ACP methyl ester carboxylesterase
MANKEISLKAVSDRPRRAHASWSFAICAVVLAAGLANYLRFDLQSYCLLTHFADPQADGFLVRATAHSVTMEEVSIPSKYGEVRARLYTPVGIARPPAMVVAHGIHHLGMDEPRLVGFAHAAAEEGYAVLTPQIESLADYRVDATSVPAIGDSVEWLESRERSGPVTLTGISFGGGLSLLAAESPEYAPHLRAIVLMGAYADLTRVSKFLVTSQAELPDGRVIPYQAHDYGAAVFVYAHIEQFFPAADLPEAKESLHEWLWEKPEKAQAAMMHLRPQSLSVVNALLARRIDELRPQLLQAIEADQQELASLSPEPAIGKVRTPVFILHGSTDNIIPSTESEWLEKDIPRTYLKVVLITPAFSHVDPEKKMDWRDEARLVSFIAAVLRYTK